VLSSELVAAPGLFQGLGPGIQTQLMEKLRALLAQSRCSRASGSGARPLPRGSSGHRGSFGGGALNAAACRRLSGWHLVAKAGLAQPRR